MPDVDFFLDGIRVTCPAGLTVAGALFFLGASANRTTPAAGEPRATFCGMGLCFDCVMRIDGRPSVRACATLVRPGMEVERLSGVAELRGPA